MERISDHYNDTNKDGEKSPMAVSRRSYMTPDIQSKSINTSITNVSSATIPSLDLSTIPRPEITDSNITSNGLLPTGWSESVKLEPNQKRKKPMPPPGGSARGGSARRISSSSVSARGKKGSKSARRPMTSMSSSTNAQQPERYQKWMNKSILEIRRANERVTNPYSPLYKRARAHSKRKSDDDDVGKKSKIRQSNMNMDNITDRLLAHLSIGVLDHESELMCGTKEKNCDLLRMRYNKLISDGNRKDKKLKWILKEITRLKVIMGENKKLSDEAESSPEVVSIKIA
jgi:hypothetical protein